MKLKVSLLLLVAYGVCFSVTAKCPLNTAKTCRSCADAGEGVKDYKNQHIDYDLKTLYV